MRGVTLIEVLIVVAIMALVATAVAIAAVKYWESAKEKTARTGALTIREAVKGWWTIREGSGCPTVQDLLSSEMIDEASARTDPWGMPWRIECDGTRATVYSNGPDRKSGTEDDIRVPPKT
ncbi:MAG TPA: prepilin-type N-terminal cleavage/methylation domain-containing protein [Polyangiaceae bacterium]|nr:prepilin-type N-terminal cleavage/methylation domain-containing protein [Polyangiaceae bacterium]